MTPFVLSLLPHDRASTDERLLVFGRAGEVLLNVPCETQSALDKATEAGNPNRDPRYPYGHHPTGRYKLTIGAKYGVHPFVLCTPVYDDTLVFGGDAWLRVQPMGVPGKPVRDLPMHDWLDINGAGSGIGLHGGALGPGGVIRKTWGCCRQRDEHQAKLVQLVRDLRIIDYISRVRP